MLRGVQSAAARRQRKGSPFTRFEQRSRTAKPKESKKQKVSYNDGEHDYSRLSGLDTALRLLAFVQRLVVDVVSAKRSSGAVTQTRLMSHIVVWRRARTNTTNSNKSNDRRPQLRSDLALEHCHWSRGGTRAGRRVLKEL